jgi:HSP20 family protein
MSDIIRWNPFREMVSMRNAMDRMFEDALIGPEWDWRQAGRWQLSLDIVENDDEFTVKASIPGINPDDLEITLSGKILTIKGETQGESESDQGKYHLRERRYGSFSRRVSLPTEINDKEVKASYDSGVLTLTLPKSEDTKPRRIEVHKVIEG